MSVLPGQMPWRPIEDRFEERYIPEPNSGCWLWTAGINRAGYGLMHTFQGGQALAHRVSWVLHGGMLTSKADVIAHRCDNPCCVNPDHLFRCTQAENVRDMDRKGRRVCKPNLGVKHHNAKLTAEQVSIAKVHVGSATPLAREFGVTPEQINNIRRGAQRKAG